MTKNQIQFLIALLKKFESTGTKPTRTQLHKIAYFVHDEIGQSVPFRFVLHKYGPYSFGLDKVVQVLTDSGDIEARYDPNGYGALYQLAIDQSDDGSLTSSSVDVALDRWVNELGTKGVRELELYATTLYVARHKKDAGRDEQAQAVKKIKPHFSDADVSSAFNWLSRKGVLDRAA